MTKRAEQHAEHAKQEAEAHAWKCADHDDDVTLHGPTHFKGPLSLDCYIPSTTTYKEKNDRIGCRFAWFKDTVSCEKTNRLKFWLVTGPGPPSAQLTTLGPGALLQGRAGDPLSLRGTGHHETSHGGRRQLHLRILLKVNPTAITASSL